MMEIAEIVASQGFPAAICIYLLWERQAVTKSLERAINNDLVHAISESHGALSQAIMELKNEITVLSERLK